MSREFYGATAEAQGSVNKLLSLPASGREQDWEFELADPNRIEEMLNAASTVELNHDEKCALALVLVASIEEAIESGLADRDLIARSRSILRDDGEVLEAMKFYWIEQCRASNEETVRQLLL